MIVEKGLLIHWWHYYGKCIYTLDELEKFEQIIDTYGADKVLEVAVASYICLDGSPTVILKAIRNNTVEKMFKSLPDITTFDKEHKEVYEETREKFVKIISSTCN